jgi:hypothetical protein
MWSLVLAYRSDAQRIACRPWIDEKLKYTDDPAR